MVGKIALNGLHISLYASYVAACLPLGELQTAPVVLNKISFQTSTVIAYEERSVVECDAMWYEFIDVSVEHSDSVCGVAAMQEAKGKQSTVKNILCVFVLMYYWGIGTLAAAYVHWDKIQSRSPIMTPSITFIRNRGVTLWSVSGTWGKAQ